MIPHPIRTRCLGCPELLVFVQGAGWQHPDGEFVRTYTVGCQTRDDHVATPDYGALEDERSPTGGVFAEGVKR